MSTAYAWTIEESMQALMTPCKEKAKPTLQDYLEA